MKRVFFFAVVTQIDFFFFLALERSTIEDLGMAQKKRLQKSG